MTNSRVRLRPIALPTEHGGWAFLLEPILLGLLLAPTLAGVLLALAATAAFLARHPFEIALGDWRRRKRYPRSAVAERFALAYGLAALTAVGLALWFSPYPFWPLLLLAAPLALVQLGYDLAKRGRDLLPELAGAVALGVLAPALARAHGWDLAPALTLWAVLAARAVPSILYVRVRLRQGRGETVSATPALLAHAAGLAAGVGLALAGLLPWLGVVALALLLGRAVYGLSPRRTPVRAAIVGMQETLIGVIVIGLLALGFLW